MDYKRESSRNNIVLFPFMARGHIIPFIALANQLQQTHNCTITFVTTKLNIPKISSSLPPNSSIHLLTIPFCGSSYGVPPGIENTDILPYHLLPNFVEASFSLKPSFRNLISGLVKHETGRLLCIISDMFFGWSQEISSEFDVSHAIFVGGSAFGYACYYSLWMNLPHRNIIGDSCDHEVALPDFPEASGIHVTQMTPFLRAANGSNRDSVIMRKRVLSEWFLPTPFCSTPWKSLRPRLGYSTSGGNWDDLFGPLGLSFCRLL